MARKPTTDLNLTPLRAHRLLREISRARATATIQAYLNVLSEIEDKLEQHVRYGLHRARRR